jgi:cytochrome c554/c'-like protein
MNSIRTLVANRASVLILAAAVFSTTGLSASAQNVQHLTITQPGGMPGLPVMTGIQRVTNGVTVTWDGPSGYYQVLQKVHLKDSKWVNWGKATNLARKATITTLTNNAFFRVLGPSPQYAGSQNCTVCHQSIHNTEMNTPHAGAFTNAQFVAEGGQTNSSCLACHTVGYGLPTGFVSKNDSNTNPRLAGVQCENCHGPAANHAANPDDPTAIPRVELAATVCGGCHTGPQHPTYEEWNSSEHAVVTADVVSAMNASTNSINSCGRCHSGSARLSLVKTEPLPVGDADVPIVCATCHDPHMTYVHTNVLNGIFTNQVSGIAITNHQVGVVYTNQLRYPYSSTNNYSLTTSATFTNAYSINVCAQCHNDLGAVWTNSIAPPHHSPQYNMLLGAVGELDSGLPPNQPAFHANVEKQCAGCHMQTASCQAGPPEIPAVTGHTFEVNSYEACAQCHGTAANAEGLVVLVQGFISPWIQFEKSQLDEWAATKAPASLWTKYGTRAWEYTTPGDLSPGGPGPTTPAEQALIPVNIQKARYNLYLVLYDGSYGVHNINYAQTLLDATDGWIQEELDK